MAVDRRSERSALRGLLVPDTGLSFDAGQSTLTQAGPRAGLPIPDRRTTTALVATGDQTFPLGVEIESGGAIDAGLALSGRWLLDRDGDSYGWDQPSVISSWELVWDNNGLDSPDDFRPQAVYAVDGDTLLIASSSKGPDPGTMKVHRKTFGGSWDVEFSTSTINDTSVKGSIRCAFVGLPSGRVLLFYSNGDIDINCIYTDDGGISWSDDPAQVYPEIQYTAETNGGAGYSEVLSLCGAYLDGNVVLFVGVRRANTDFGSGKNRDGFIQLASSDLGQNFTEITTTDWFTSTPPSFTTGAGGTCAVTKNGTILFAWVSGTSSPCHARIVSLSSAFQPFTEQPDAELTDAIDAGLTQSAPVSGDQMNDWDCTVVVAENGVCWAYLRDLQKVCPFLSEDHGVTWTHTSDTGNLALTPDIGHLYRAESVDSYPRELRACAWRNGVALVHSWSSDSSSFGDVAFGIAYLGGHRSVAMTGDPPDREIWQHSWVPFDAPENVGWTDVGGGTSTLTSSGLEITTAGSTRHYTRTVDGSRIAVRATVAVASGTVASRNVFIKVDSDVGGTYSECEVRIGTTSIAVYDSLTGLQVGSTYSIDATVPTEVWIVCAGAATRVWAGTQTPGGPQLLGAVLAQTSLSTATGTPGSSVSWGHGVLSTASSTWYDLFVSADDADLFVSANSNVPGAPLSSHSVYVSDGVSIRAEGGPAWDGDTWTITPRYAFGIDRVDPVESPSPRRGWRSTTDADDCYLAFSDGGAERHWAGLLLGFGFFGANFSIGEIQTRSPAGTWSTLCDFSSSQPGLIQLAYTRKGATIVPASSTGGNPQLRLDELKGASIYLASGVVRRIVSNSAGKWSTASGFQRPVITIDLDGLDEFTAASGTASIVPKDFVVITRAPATEIRGVRVYIEGQDTAEGWFELGTLVCGHIEVFGDDYSWGRVEDVEPAVERTRLRGGTTRTRVLAPPARRVTFNWAEGVDASRVEGEEPDPDYLTSSSTASSPTVATIGSTPYQIAGLISYLDSGVVPVVYLPSIPLGSTGVDTHTLNRRDQILLAQVPSPVSLESVQGEEGEDEVWRVAQIELEEVV